MKVARDPGRRDAPLGDNKILKDRRSPRRRGRTGTSVMDENAPVPRDPRLRGPPEVDDRIPDASRLRRRRHERLVPPGPLRGHRGVGGDRTGGGLLRDRARRARRAPPALPLRRRDLIIAAATTVVLVAAPMKAIIARPRAEEPVRSVRVRRVVAVVVVTVAASFGLGVPEPALLLARGVVSFERRRRRAATTTTMPTGARGSGRVPVARVAPGRALRARRAVAKRSSELVDALAASRAPTRRRGRHRDGRAASE